MHFSTRASDILKQLHECGQVASVEQLQHNKYDAGHYCSQLTICLNTLVKRGYISVRKLPLDWRIKTTACRKLYFLEELGAEYLEVPFYHLSESPKIMKSNFMLSEILRQFNASGYRLVGSFFHDGIYGFKLKSESFSVFCSWNDDFAKNHLKYFMKRKGNPKETMFAFFIEDKNKYVTWKAYTQSAEFNNLCTYETDVYMPQLPLSLASVGECVPFNGWDTLSRIEV
jgi:hypothetical protein